MLVDSDVHLPVFRSLDLHRPDNYRNIGITVKSPTVKTRYRLIATVDFRFARQNEAARAADAAAWVRSAVLVLVVI
jgi:hypothetical protein